MALLVSFGIQIVQCQVFSSHRLNNTVYIELATRAVGDIEKTAILACKILNPIYIDVETISLNEESDYELDFTVMSAIKIFIMTSLIRNLIIHIWNPEILQYFHPSLDLSAVSKLDGFCIRTIYDNKVYLFPLAYL